MSKRGGDPIINNIYSNLINVAFIVLPLIFAYWAALITSDYVPPLAFAFTWAVLCVIHFAHVQRSDILALTSDHTEARLQHSRINAIINNLADAIIATDATGKVQLSNASSLSLLDTNQLPVGKGIDSVVPLQDSDGRPVSLNKLLKESTTTVARDDLDLKQGDELLHLSLIFAPIRGTDSLGKYAQNGYIIIMRDITRQKSLEEERDEFISIVSHELRTPITIAEGSLSNLQIMNDRGQASQAQLASGITMAHDQVVFLASMINDLSTLSRAERGVMSDRAKIEVETFIHGIYNQYQAEAHKKGLQFNLSIQPQLGSVEASELYLRELIQNFITNAIKYTKQGSVTLSVQKQGDNLVFAVKDTGIGISKGDQKKVFNKFFRSEDYRTRETSGTGLGLYVARKLSHLMDTQVTLESRLNHGSTFSFELPQFKG